MDSFELNKILGALLATCLLVLCVNFAANAVFSPGKPAKPGYDIAVKEDDSHGAAAAASSAPEVPIATLLATANVERGATAAKKCASCHTFEKGGPNRVGPNLYGIIGRNHGAAAGFNFSAAMKAKASEAWTFDSLNAFIRSPKAAVPGTNMAFAGISRDTERADLLVYLRSLADSPVALPQAASK